MKNTALCPLLDYKRFESIFGNVQESELTAQNDEVLKWYSSVGKKKLRKLEWEFSMAKNLGIKIPFWATSDQVSTFANGATEYDGGEKWLEAAKKVIREDLGIDVFEFAGIGSSKVCFYAKNGIALKFARTDSLAEEIRNNMRFSGYSCIPQMFDHDELDMKSYVCEFAREAVQDDFRTLYGVDDAEEFVKLVKKGLPFPKKLSPELINGIRQMSEMLGKLKLIDIDRPENFGIAVRNGIRQIIMIDYDL